MEIGNIIQGHINEVLGLNKDIQTERLKICQMCPLFLNKLGGICNSKLWLNPNTNQISTKQKDGFKRGCGCRLQAKTSLPNAKCPLGKW